MLNLASLDLELAGDVTSRIVESAKIENFVLESITRFEDSDWGDTDTADKNMNDVALDIINNDGSLADEDVRPLAAFYSLCGSLGIWIKLEDGTLWVTFDNPFYLT